MKRGFLTKCPKCDTAVDFPYKTWALSQKTAKSKGGRKITFGMFRCPKCGNKFRRGVRDREKKEVSIKSAAEKIRGIEGELVNTLKNLREKLKTLETERANLLLEIEELKRMAEGRANALESEVDMLKEEVKSLKELLGVGEIDTH